MFIEHLIVKVHDLKKYDPIVSLYCVVTRIPPSQRVIHKEVHGEQYFPSPVRVTLCLHKSGN